jgi:hypothetical protein
MRRLPDQELIALAHAGSADAAAALFDRYWVHAWSAAYAVTADQALAGLPVASWRAPSRLERRRGSRSSTPRSSSRGNPAVHRGCAPDPT